MSGGWLSSRDTRTGSASGRAWRGWRSGKGAFEESAAVRRGCWGGTGGAERTLSPAPGCLRGPPGPGPREPWGWGAPSQCPTGLRRGRDPGAEYVQRPPGCFPTCCCFRLNACFSPTPPRLLQLWVLNCQEAPLG